MRPLYFLGFAVLPAGALAQTADTTLLTVDRWIQARAEADSFSGAVLVARNGIPVLRRGYGFANRETNEPVTPDTKFNLGSIDKLITRMCQWAATCLITRTKRCGSKSLRDSCTRCGRVSETS
jgi:CubicO group peptidase (beta-lactamase class C family)